MQPTPPTAPLQFGWLPVEALILAALTFVVPAFLSLWVLIDAKEQTDHALAWGLAVLLGGLTPFYVGAVAVTVLYHLSREELGSIAPPSVTNETVDRGEVLGDPAREDEGNTRAERAPQRATVPPAPRHEEQFGGDTVTGMGPDGQARWEGRVEAGLGIGAGDDSSGGDSSDGADEQADEGYDEATSMGEGEWSDDEPTTADGGSEESPPDLGGFEMADPIEGSDGESGRDDRTRESETAPAK